MTPFDASALLAMLLAFYPIVGPAALARARRERPEYFAGGAIIGREGDALRLPDGRVFDLIFQVNTPGQHWQVLQVGDGTGPPPADDPFALEDGPVRPIDESAIEFPPFGDVFGAFVRGGLAEYPNTDAQMGGAATTIAEVLARGIDPAPDAALVSLTGEPAAIDAALVQAIPDVELGATHEQGGEAGGARHEFDEPLPPELPPGPEVPAPPTGPDVPDVPNT